MIDGRGKAEIIGKNRGEDTYEHQNKHAAEDALERFDILDTVRAYTNVVYSFIRACEGRDVRESFNDEQKEVYDQALRIARTRSGDFDKQYLRKKEKLERPVYIGHELETDKKIAATAYALAIKEPVLVATHDRGLITLLSRVKQSLEDYDSECLYALNWSTLGSISFGRNGSFETEEYVFRSVGFEHNLIPSLCTSC